MPTYKNFDVYLHVKNELHPLFYVVILGTLGMLHHPHQKSKYQFVGNFYGYLHEDIAKK